MLLRAGRQVNMPNDLRPVSAFVSLLLEVYGAILKP
jgi:hypothetical protein